MNKDPKSFKVYPFDHNRWLDRATKVAYSDNDLSVMIDTNRGLYGSQNEICVDGKFYALVELEEFGSKFNLLVPYLSKPKVKGSNAYAFGVYFPPKNQLFMLFGGKKVAETREKALFAYGNLMERCATINQDLIPFIVKWKPC